MSQFKGSAPRRVSGGGNLDVYTVLALAGVFALVVLLASLWMKGGELASDSSSKASPWTLLRN
ncbi:MAG: hypothetical protein KJZ69_11410 [Phycisphaerales bacterium]|nr:hypothetical protein [Phycisphaerales bacterium]